MLTSDITLTPEEKQRFYSRIVVSETAYCYRSGSFCWEWTAGKSSHGYGTVWLRGGSVGAHRVAYLLHYGAIPNNLFVCHVCDNPPCCNPTHLFVGTNGDNIRDKCEKGRHNCGRGERHSSRTKPERVARGDRNGSRLHPERLARGERHGSRTKPESRPRGERHGFHTKPECVPRGDRHWKAKLRDTDIPEIFRLRATGMLHREIAAVFGVSRTHISLILSGGSRAIPARVEDLL